jgi:hypothetical protein
MDDVEKLRHEIHDWRQSPTVQPAAADRVAARQRLEQLQTEHSSCRESHGALRRRAEQLDRDGAPAAVRNGGAWIRHRMMSIRRGRSGMKSRRSEDESCWAGEPEADCPLFGRLRVSARLTTDHLGIGAGPPVVLRQSDR